MSNIALNIMEPEEITRVKSIFHDVMLALPIYYQTNSVRAEVAESILKLVAEGERDALRLKERIIDRYLS